MESTFNSFKTTSFLRCSSNEQIKLLLTMLIAAVVNLVSSVLFFLHYSMFRFHTQENGVKACEYIIESDSSISLHLRVSSYSDDIELILIKLNYLP